MIQTKKKSSGDSTLTLCFFKVKLGKISKETVQAEAVEILMALKKLGEPVFLFFIVVVIVIVLVIILVFVFVVIF